MARLFISGEDRGVRSFIVPICNETEMYPGVTSIRLPRTIGTGSIDFSLTSFNHVHLPITSLLGSSIDTPKNPREAWWTEVWRLSYGSMVVCAPLLQGLKHVAYIGARYSFRRHVTIQGKQTAPIITFPTQQWAVLHATAVATIIDVWYRRVTYMISDTDMDPRVKHGMAIVVKATTSRQVISCSQLVSERCGAQGILENNFMARFQVRPTYPDCSGIF